MSSTRRTFLRRSVGVVATASACGVEGLETETVPPGSTVAAARAHAQVALETVVNGDSISLKVGPDETALEVLRTQMGLTGSKLGCGHGSCGACAVQLDGTPVAACILPATSLHRRNVQTIEGLSRGRPQGLHPVQIAFMAEDALQCGYCTPGFVVESIAFYERWRDEKPGTAPSRDDVAAALAGHLCRCGAYDGIYRAVIGACAGEFEGAPRPAPRYDALEKVTGAATYTVDVQRPGMLHAKALHAPMAHARIRRLDWSLALKIPGVRAVVALLEQGRLVRFAGQEIVAVAAIDEATAREALQAIDIEFEPLAAALDMNQAIEAKALVWPKRQDKKHPPNAAEGPLLGAPWDGNVRGPFKLFSKNPGGANRAIDAASGSKALFQGHFETAVQCHTSLEPHAAVADWQDGNLRVWLSTQGVQWTSDDLAERFGLRDDDVEVIAQYIGGGFGSKGTLQTEAIIAVELSRAAGAPVRYALDRREEIMIGGNRPGTRTDLALAIDATGQATGMRARVYSNSGIAVGHATSPFARILYPKIAKDLHDYDVVTHAPPGKPFRGPGGPQTYFAIEQAIDALATQRREDALAMRKRWDPNPARQPLYAWAESHKLWAGRRTGADTGRYRRGVGLAYGAWLAFTEPKTQIELEVAKGRVTATTASQDIGNGTRTVIATVVAERLGLQPQDVRVEVGSSKYVHGCMSAGSRSVSSLVPACLHATEEIRDELLDLAQTRHGGRAKATEDGVEVGGKIVPWPELIAELPRTRVVGRRRRDRGGYVLPPIMGLAIEKYVSSSIQFVEVEVDTRLGKIRALRAAGGYNVGKIVTLPLAKSQAMGGMIQGLSYALYEERRLDPAQGFLLTGNLEDYRIMGIGDVPELEVHFAEDGYENVRGRSVGLGELVTLAPAAALANAVAHATGFRPQQIPVRVDRMMEGLA